MIFWLTVRTGISDPELVFDSHSSPPVMSELVPIYENSMDSIPADKVLKKTLLDLQKRFPIYHVCPKCLAVLMNSLAFHQELDEVEKRWLTGNVKMSTAY